MLGHRFLKLLPFLDRFFDRSYQVEGLLGQIIVLAVNDFAKAADRIRQADVFSFETGELLRHEEGLRKKPDPVTSVRQPQ